MVSPLIVIGAQKCGTATLTEDLSCCKGLWVDGSFKEESPLLALNPKSDNESVVKWFLKGDPSKILVNISTRYAMRPTTEVDVASLMRVFPACRIIYLLREPIKRTLSHHHHDQVLGITQLSAEEAITVSSSYVHHSMYGMQLEPWCNEIPESRIMLIKFEEYIANRQGTIEDVCDFLGIPSDGVENIESDVQFNVTSERVRFHPLIARIIRSDAYTHLVKKTVGKNLRERIKSIMATENHVSRSEISLKLERALAEIYANDHLLLQRLHKGAPSWG